MDTLSIRPLAPTDRAAWEPLWQGYQTFYKADIPAATSDRTWQNFHNPLVPVYAHGAWIDADLVGIVHFIYHYTTWTVGPYCYLQDLFTAEPARGRGVGRALIESVYATAADAGASRVYWLTHETNEQAMLLYDKLAARSGFVQYRKIL